MFWNKYIIRLYRLTVVLIMGIGLSQCYINSNSIQPTSATLKKGEKINDAALVSEGSKISFSVIDASNNWDNNIKIIDTPRPKSIDGYNTYIPNSKKFLKSASINLLTFDWNSTKSEVLVVAIFKNIIKVTNNEIANKEDIVWFWTPVQGKSDTGSIGFKDGKMAQYDKTTQQLKPIASPNKLSDLSVGTYVWCVWAFDKDGVNIVASSREIPFSISN